MDCVYYCVLIVKIVIYLGVFGERPTLPLPTEEQVRWQELEINGFIHFGVNTYTGILFCNNN